MMRTGTPTGRRRVVPTGRHRAPRARLRPRVFAVAGVLAMLVAGLGAVAGENRDSVAVADPGIGPSGGAGGFGRSTGTSPTSQAKVAPGFEIERSGNPLPEASGRGRRVVFSEGQQRVWLVDTHREVVSTHPVSGSRHDNLSPGTYEVFSRSRHATAYDYASTMAYFVRFTRGTGGSAIGFHDIPVADGEPVQTFDQLGTPLSSGCIRQRRADAIEVWEFATVGTTVVVTD